MITPKDIVSPPLSGSVLGRRLESIQLQALSKLHRISSVEVLTTSICLTTKWCRVLAVESANLNLGTSWGRDMHKICRILSELSSAVELAVRRLSKSQLAWRFRYHQDILKEINVFVDIAMSWHGQQGTYSAINRPGAASIGKIIVSRDLAMADELKIYEMRTSSCMLMPGHAA